MKNRLGGIAVLILRRSAMRRPILCGALAVVLAGWGGWAAVRTTPAGAVPSYAVLSYPLIKIVPKGFSVYQGIWDWVPVSADKGIAFARNKDEKTGNYSLVSYSLSKEGVCSSPRTIAAGINPRAAACVWIDDGVSGDRAAGPYGLVFVLSETWGKSTDTATVSVAKFNSSGGVVGGWTQILKATTPKGWYICEEALFALRRGKSVGVVPTLCLQKHSGYSPKSLIYFLEAAAADGGLIGGAKQLPLPKNGRDIYGLGFAPGWNGTSWLVPAATTAYKPNGDWKDILENKALVYVVSGGETHTAVMNEIATDKVISAGTYDLCLTRHPESDADMLMFVRHRTLIPKSQQKLDLFKYDFSLKRLDIRGQLVNSVAVSLPAPVHKLVYDAAYKLWWEYDYLSECLAKDGTIYISRARTVELLKENSGDEKYEQEVDFYAVNPLTGAAGHRARTVHVWDKINLFRPWIDIFPGGPIGVVNCAYHIPSPYPWDNYLALFNY